MRKETAIRKFNEFYDKAVKLSYVEKPISWALYQTWKWFDKKEKSRIAESEDKGMTREQAINYLKSTGMSDEQIKAVVNAISKEESEEA